MRAPLKTALASWAPSINIIIIIIIIIIKFIQVKTGLLSALYIYDGLMDPNYLTTFTLEVLNNLCSS